MRAEDFADDAGGDELRVTRLVVTDDLGRPSFVLDGNRRVIDSYDAEGNMLMRQGIHDVAGQAEAGLMMKDTAGQVRLVAAPMAVAVYDESGSEPAAGIAVDKGRVLTPGIVAQWPIPPTRN